MTERINVIAWRIRTVVDSYHPKEGESRVPAEPVTFEYLGRLWDFIDGVELEAQNIAGWARGGRQAMTSSQPATLAGTMVMIGADSSG